MDVDLLLRGATLVDGTGAPPTLADVAIRSDRIVAVGILPDLPAARECDLQGLVLCPGFIDIHTHSDLTLLHDRAGASKVLQGVTTEVTGNCSISAFPFASERLSLHRDHLDWIGDTAGLDLDWRDLDGYADQFSNGGAPALNVAPLVGHGAIRIAAMGFDQRSATAAELAAMCSLLAESLDQGAFGMSTGLTIVPSSFGSPDEVCELAKVVAGRDALYATHSRSPVGEDFPDIRDALSTATAAGVRLQFSHLAINEPARWGQADRVVALFEDAESKGLDVGFDVYPYAASSSPLVQYLPGWVQEGGTEELRERMSSASTRARAEAELSTGFFGGIPWIWDRVVVSRAGAPDTWCTGLSIERIADELGVDPAAVVLDLCLRHGNSVDIVLFYRTEEDMSVFLAHRLAAIGSDGMAFPFEQQGRKPHPRSFGTYPRILGRYVRDKQTLGLGDAVHKMTGVVADRLKIADRGRVEEGAFADLAVFDPVRIVDQATFFDPTLPPIGVVHVLVNGEFVVEDGRQTQSRPGRFLRRAG
ncbi:D-aminoacylase [Amycolatopsis sp.]|uniref:N-acyl-D-amino-acid deacylase family protein n=1 Tax=Amycolatopsis sp. TaxID=37632 RepID=UPI002B6903B8|nr:D-aminoacylase [Amycolatopsis sp.]HVV11190.1 D-aminoacylase [Amycolatopsis sp.]